MASCRTLQWAGTSPYVRLTVEAQSSTATTVTYRYALEYIASSAASTSVNKEYHITINASPKILKTGTYNINGKTGTNLIYEGTFTVNKTTSARDISFNCSFAFNLTWSGVYKGTLTSASGNVTVPALPTYTITYDANGGTGTPGKQTKTHGIDITLTSSTPSRIGYIFKGWGTSVSTTTVSYASGAKYTGNANLTLYAIWTAKTYKVSYNANGGTGAPGNQTKTYGVTLKLASTKPTRTNYTFVGWGTSASSTTVAYAAGANYTQNVELTLYAIWELSYVPPRITGLSLTRCDESGLAKDDGTSAYLSFSWATDTTAKTVYIDWENESGETGSTTDQVSGTSGTFNKVINGPFTVETTYEFKIGLEDNVGTRYIFATLHSAKFVIDFKAGGKGAAFGKTAELDDVLDIGFQTRFLGGILPPVLEPETDLNDIRTPNAYTGANISTNNYLNCPVTSGTFVLVVESCGEVGQVRQTYSSCSKYKPEKFVRFYYQGEWGDWFWAGSDEVVLYENDSGSNGMITLEEALSNYRYIEIYFTDNNGKSGGYTKVWSPNGKTICLNIVETSSTTSVIQRQTMYELMNYRMTPKTDVAGYLQFNPSTKVISNSPVGTNYIKIVRVIGRA